MLNVWAVQGRLTKDPELKTTENGISVCTFTLASDKNYVKQGETREANFFNIVTWRQTAEFVAKYFHKGNLVVVNGEGQSRTYEDKDGKKHSIVELVASNVSFCESKKNSPDVTKDRFDEIPDDDFPSDEELPF